MGGLRLSLFRIYAHTKKNCRETSNDFADAASGRPPPEPYPLVTTGRGLRLGKPRRALLLQQHQLSSAVCTCLSEQRLSLFQPARLPDGRALRVLLRKRLPLAIDDGAGLAPLPFEPGKFQKPSRARPRSPAVCSRSVLPRKWTSVLLLNFSGSYAGKQSRGA